MINVSEKYKELCESPNRPKGYITAKYGSFDKTIKGKIKSTVGNKQPFSSYDKLFNEIKTTNFNYISCEPNRVRLDDTFYFIDNKSTANVNENIAYWSLEISDNNGYFTNNPRLIITFEEKTNFMELSLYFQEICKEFNVYYYNDSSLVNTRNIKNNLSLTVETTGSTSTQEIKINRVEIEFVATKEPNRYIKLNEIDFGQYLTFSNSQILDFDIIDEISIDGEELSSNSLSLVINNSKGDYDVLNPNSKLALLQEKQEISIYHYMDIGSQVKELPLGTFLLKSAKVNGNKLNIEAYDQIYFMNDIYYGSKYYENENVNDILLDLFKFFNFTDYTIDSNVENIYLSGYIPNVSFREALRLIVEASCLCAKQTRYGKTHIFKEKDEIVKTFNRDYIFKENPSKRLNNLLLDIKEYNYTTRTENFEIYNSEIKANENNYIISFNQVPILPDTLSKVDKNDNNYEIIQSYATGCVIKVYNDTTVKLKATLINKTSASTNPLRTSRDYSFKEVDNTLITKNNSSKVFEWKTKKSDINYNFKFPLIPYVEVGDKCYYKTRFNTSNPFIITKLQFSKSILEDIEGE